MKTIKPIDLFNMLQDLKHLIIIDNRKNQEIFIRGSFQYNQDLEQDLLNYENNLTPEDKKIKRVVYIENEIKEIQHQFQKNYLLQNFGEFYNKYPFLCVNEKSQQIEILFAQSQFPQEIIENELFIGNIYQSDCTRHLKALNIKSLVNFSLKNNKNAALSIPIDPKITVDIDFDEILNQINQLKKPVMMYCQDGDTISTAFAIAYLIKNKGKELQFASLFILSKRNNNAKICKWLYTQIMVYQPKKN